jgi:hypothetical protein
MVAHTWRPPDRSLTRPDEAVHQELRALLSTAIVQARRTDTVVVAEDVQPWAGMRSLHHGRSFSGSGTVSTSVAGRLMSRGFGTLRTESDRGPAAQQKNIQLKLELKTTVNICNGD